MPAFGAAYETGELSWVRALALLPVLGESTAAGWTAWAQAVTVRRLVAEVEWSLDQRDAVSEPAAGAPPGPPPAGHDLAADAAQFFDVERQMRARRKQIPVEREREARPDWSPHDAEIAFAGPAAVVALGQRGIHAGLVRASGTAPKKVRWELGLRAGQPPLLRLVGDMYESGEECAGGEACVEGPGALVTPGTEVAA